MTSGPEKIAEMQKVFQSSSAHIHLQVNFTQIQITGVVVRTCYLGTF